MLYALALNVFYEANNIAAGGLAGIAILLRAFLPIKTSILILVMNVPLLVLGGVVKGVGFIRNTIISALIYNLLVELTAPLPPLAGHPLFAAVLGGTCMGIGMALMAYSNSSIGGTELIIRVLLSLFTKSSIGRLCLIVDGTIAVASVVVFKDITSGIYALMALTVTAICADRVFKEITF